VSPTGRIFEIQRFSIHDGPGIRTTVFLKGCPMRCLWCHNPEGIAVGTQLSFTPEKCIGCGTCLTVCPRRAHRLTDGLHTIDRAVCEVCGRCAETCYAGALETIGQDITVEDALAAVLRDRPFYETSGGGMTLSGGEPLLQIDFSEALLRAAKREGLHTAVETCGHVDADCFRRVLQEVDLFLYDIKETDPQRHAECTGVPNDLILDNLNALHEAGAAILLRLPIIPGLNDRPDFFTDVADLAKRLPRLLGVELMPYHRLGEGKRARLGEDQPSAFHADPPTPATVSQWAATLRDRGVHVVSDANSPSNA